MAYPLPDIGLFSVVKLNPATLSSLGEYCKISAVSWISTPSTGQTAIAAGHTTKAMVTDTHNGVTLTNGRPLACVRALKLIRHSQHSLVNYISVSRPQRGSCRNLLSVQPTCWHAGKIFLFTLYFCHAYCAV